MHDQRSSTQYEIAGILSETLRSFQRRRELRRMRMDEAYAATMSATGPTSGPPPGSPRPPAASADMAKMFGAAGWVDTGGRAVPVMDDPAKLQALYDQAAAVSGLSPSDFILAFSGTSPAHARPVVDPVAAGAAANAAPPPEVPKTSASPPPPVETAAPVDPVTPATDGAPQQSASPASATRESILADMEGLLARRADEDAARFTALLREHEVRMAQQAEAATAQQATLLREHEARMAQQAEASAKQQASLLREVMDGHVKQLDAQAARHTQVVRDLLREQQVELDEHSSMAAAKEVQMVGALLREHREALEEAQGAHRRDLEEILEHHRGELQAVRKAPVSDGASTQLRELLAEQARQQHAAHTQSSAALSSLTETVKTLGEAVTKLVDHCARQQADLFSLPPPSFIPAVPSTPTAFTPPVVSPPAATSRCSSASADAPNTPALPDKPQNEGSVATAATSSTLQSVGPREGVTSTRHTGDCEDKARSDDGSDNESPRRAPPTSLETEGHVDA